MTAIFIDGPLAQEVKQLPDLPDRWHVALPPRITTCWCAEDGFPIELRRESEIFVYHRIMKGGHIGLYSKNSDPDEVVKALTSWVVTDLTDDLHYACRERRAFE